jgi:lipoprotein signal peptidase
MAERNLELHQPVPILGESLRLMLAYNQEVAFGLFSNASVLPTLLTSAILLVLLLWVVCALARGRIGRRLVWPLGMVVGLPTSVTGYLMLA